MVTRQAALILGALFAVGCGVPAGRPLRPDAGPSDGGGGGGGGGGGPGHPVSAQLQACAEQSLPVGSVSQLVARLNALPRPVSVACLVASVPRPLNLVATTSVFSAQPASGRKSPRIFLLQPGMVLSVVPDGPGGKLLEVGQWVTATRTLKGELAFPVTEALPDSAPLTHVEQSNGTTTCAVCHRAEERHPSIDGGYVSVAFRPNPGEEVKLPAVAVEHQACMDSGEQSARCDLLHALFDFGAVKQGAFSPSVALFIQ